RLDEEIGHYEQALRINPKLAMAHYNLGIALRANGRLDEAIGHYEQALRINPKFAEYATAHGALGQALLELGCFTNARDATRRCLDLLPRSHPMRTFVMQQQRRCERILFLEDRLPPTLSGKEKPASPAEGLEFGWLCQVKKQHAAAVRLLMAAFAADPKAVNDIQAGHRYHAACCAVLAA